MKRILAIIFVIIMYMDNVALAKFGNYEVHFLGVGQSDCILIKTDDKNYLIDTGAAYYTKRIIRYLDLNQVKSIDGIILTHYHDDHYEGIIKIAQSRKVCKVYLPDHRNYIQNIMSDKLNKMGVDVEYIKRGWEIKNYGCVLKAIGPVRESKTVENNNSIVLQGKVNGLQYVFAGDCERSEEEDILKTGELKKCDVLKVPHHGLNTSTTNRFLDRVEPRVAIITSDGVGTPDKRVENRLINKGAIVWRIDNQGNIVIKNDILYCSKNYTSIRLK
ncbi:ComEC/Rec2 family competence protein [Clostridium sp. HV4-5-A1G]|jgi:beta-lactamase superfamily II metal-dependent hydrolase|uniref:ComEC/Rec2 family competence protein n=2 Tax=unclassified Clostridium TaxID=2614128 RepID=UPI00123AB142|nr:MBL fold metallo-hydrolase [Clostridium sp. HV4-5-A1G]KAA8672429.1 MBL fold metallo-hydrolase [Clostridium sp. HV4-5-A1G]CAB1251492.1 MBL fold metallo-hydrolase [Clostridiaceae bacterium BL-3]